MNHAQGKATRIRLLSISTPHMRAFHMAWLAFFVCFFAWFALAPLTAVVRKEFGLTQAQVGNIVIASVAITILARLLAGWLCDRYGPRLTYAGLLLLGSLPVMTVGLARDYQTYLMFRLAIGAIGASFVITQYHTSMMFAPNCVGTANATTAGWGNMGGGAAQILMPLFFSFMVGLGIKESWGWRLAMVIPGSAMLLTGVAYLVLTQDTPQGNLADLRKRGHTPASPKAGGLLAAGADTRVWALSLVYGACFGIEITVHNVAALYFTDRFSLGLKEAGLIVGAFGMLALFARTLGGWVSDKASLRMGFRGRTMCLGLALLAEGVLLILFSRAARLPAAIVGLILFGLFVHISCGATYAMIPFVNRKAVGSVAGIVGAGGNLGAVLSSFLFKSALAWDNALLLLGLIVTACAALTLLVRFAPAESSADTAVDLRYAEPVALPV